MRRVVTAAGVLFVLDRLTKILAISQGWAIRNPGISFSFGRQVSALGLAIISGVLLVVMTIGLWKQFRRRPIALGLLWAGALSNVIDRFMYGAVIDWLSYPNVPITNNLADWAIALSMVLVAWEVVTEREAKG